MVTSSLVLRKSNQKALNPIEIGEMSAVRTMKLDKRHTYMLQDQTRYVLRSGLYHDSRMTWKAGWIKNESGCRYGVVPGGVSNKDRDDWLGNSEPHPIGAESRAPPVPGKWRSCPKTATGQSKLQELQPRFRGGQRESLQDWFCCKWVYLFCWY